MEWRKIPDICSDYEINERAEIRSKKYGTWRPIKIMLGKVGYFVFAESNRGVVKKHLVHRCLAKAFIPNPRNLPEVNHKNLIRTDNDLENLEWVTHAENMRHASSHGLMRRIKLSQEDVEKIRHLAATTNLSQAAIARQFGCCQQLVSLYVHGYRS